MSVTTQSPAWAPEQLLPSMRQYLIDAGVTRRPKDAGAQPPMWLDPRKGIPYPGQTEGLAANESHPSMVLAAFPATGTPSVAYEGFIVKANATIWYRGLNSPPVQVLHEQIRGLLHDRHDYYMNGLWISESLFFRDKQRISSDERGYVYNCEVQFEMWASTYNFQ